MEIPLLLAILAFALVSFARQWLPIEVTALVALGLLLLFDLVTPEEAIAGFANPAVITVMMMFILSEALVQSGVIDRLGHRITRWAGDSGPRAMLVLLLLAGLVSAFVSNTATVAVLMPVALLVAKRYRLSPSKLLLPLSYVSIAGGTVTLIGTSTNLLTSSLAVAHGLPPFGVFELAPLGLAFLAVGVAYSVLVLVRVLPARVETRSLTGKYQLAAYLTEVRVPPASPLVGKTVVEVGLSERFGLTMLEVLRGSEKIAHDLRNTRLAGGDVLLVRGAMEDVVALKEHYGLLLLSDVKLDDAELADQTNVLAEVQVAPQSRLVDRSLADVDFRKRYGSFVLAVNRLGEVIRDKVALLPLQAFDILLVFGPRVRVQGLEQQEDFVPLREVGVKLRLSRRWWIGAAIIPLVALAAASGLMPILKAALLGVVALLVLGAVTMPQAYKAIDWSVIFLLAAILPLGLALEKHGLAAIAGGAVADLGRPLGPVAVVALVVVATTLVTELISNNSAAVLMVPVAVSAAASLGIDPKPLLMAVTYAASMSFLTPIGYQTNMMVYGPGGYRFADYFRAGAPLTLVFWLLAVLLIPRLWPF
ncbi:MAG TPA: SLC13 family permease [Thermoanaerobaculia bacterium]|nr:SLC13 family permease [Thermoanaerobaculia bacterium]